MAQLSRITRHPASGLILLGGLALGFSLLKLAGCSSSSAEASAGAEPNELPELAASSAAVPEPAAAAKPAKPSPPPLRQARLPDRRPGSEG
jgi:hypothetical protein